MSAYGKVLRTVPPLDRTKKRFVLEAQHRVLFLTLVAGVDDKLDVRERIRRLCGLGCEGKEEEEDRDEPAVGEHASDLQKDRRSFGGLGQGA
jgi:hypothetical protein